MLPAILQPCQAFYTFAPEHRLGAHMADRAVFASCAQELMAQAARSSTAGPPPTTAHVQPESAMGDEDLHAAWLQWVRTELEGLRHSLAVEQRRVRMARRWLDSERRRWERARSWLREAKRRVRVIKRLMGPARHLLAGGQ